MIVEQRHDDQNDQFPAGMRVLAVDDDPLCLRLLETLLRKCQYQVTTTSQAVMALKLLRENRDKFDLVISDVQMPDMDGFKLLELVGLEMDLPVIMLSSYGDTKLVMKGITHGAVDYLLKPVRIEELQNIWQHVVRRKKRDSKDRNHSHNGENDSCRVGEGNGSRGVSNYDQYARTSKKRKDQNEEEDEENDDSGNDNEDPSSQKKPRVVWSVDLHRKFVAAVNQLGLDKAVPKKILELMNVEKLTRENVASHLQKYRLYLRRIHTVANQQANLVAALGGTDSAYLHMASVNFHNFNNSGQFQSNALRSIPPPNGLLSRLNTPASLGGLHGLSPSGMVPLGHPQISRYSANDCTKFQSGLLPGEQTGNILQGMPTSLEFDQLPHKKGITGGVGEFSVTNNNSMIFTSSSTANVIGGSSNSFLGLPNNSVVLQGQSGEAQSHGAFGNQSSLDAVSLNSDSSTSLPEDARCNATWAAAVQSTSLPSNDCYDPAVSNAVNPRWNAPTTLHGGIKLQNISSNIPLSSQAQDSRLDAQGQAALLSNNAVQGMTFAPKQVLESQKLNVLCDSDFVNSSMNPSIAVQADQQNGAESSAMQAAVKLKQGYLMEQWRSLGGYSVNDAGSLLEDVVSAIFKRDPDGKTQRRNCI
ncbi:hypothetical protein Ancab_023250 [Ancistrocladus abbreviatus]